jgi:hypothetical protein
VNLEERRAALPYLPVCILLGIVLGQIPRFLHGPIPYKFDIHYLHGSRMVWAFYTARMMIGFWVGATAWPSVWWLRGPLCGALTILPVLFISLSTPECGWPCVRVNSASAIGVGLAVAGLAYLITGRHHR